MSARPNPLHRQEQSIRGENSQQLRPGNVNHAAGARAAPRQVGPPAPEALFWAEGRKGAEKSRPVTVWVQAASSSGVWGCWNKKAEDGSPVVFSQGHYRKPHGQSLVPARSLQSDPGSPGGLLDAQRSKL